ncbi:hypothetical protein DPMN_124060 [Dreissena polymorpha]|uniref:Uncharacterized protein n=1 Tax=Dreissena polymorpha TaxID=45954 RepID=A0A9D4GRJ3_DREPO|nr:hypothetical protein DPMN_124060 [Dreissena polymorpha]
MWTQKAGYRQIQHKCLQRLLLISYTELKINKYVRNITATLVGPQEPLMAIVKQRKICQGCQKKSWMDNVNEWPSHLMDELLSAVKKRPDAGGFLYCRPSFLPNCKPVNGLMMILTLQYLPFQFHSVSVNCKQHDKHIKAIYKSDYTLIH